MYRVHPFSQADPWDVSKVMVPTQVLQVLLMHPEMFAEEESSGADGQEKCIHCGR